MATRYLGKHTKITLQWEKTNEPPWVVGLYRASFNCSGKKLDNIILHVFRGPHTPGTKATGRTPDDLGLSEGEMNRPHAYDLAAQWAVEELIRGARETPHWRYGRAVDCAKELQRDIAENGKEIRRTLSESGHLKHTRTHRY